MTTARIEAERAAVLAEAMTWMGTPFHHRAAIKHVGVDCAQFLLACYGAAGVVETDSNDIGDYSADWFLHESGSALDRFTNWVTRLCDPVTTPAPADIALFAYGRATSHGAIVVNRLTVIHSFRELGVVLGSLEPTHDLYPRLAGYWRLKRWSLS